ncbi:MAG TPA: pyridoxal 5'-phosphate synthase glutaminase subunit PdxT [Bryobacteraceae bacterium]|nr:pyridoxal 5'-phosphate synthase glutaminase subunit PdxT [Bryobacteraceae bacterium]
MKTIGILALQGDFHAHLKAVERAGGRAMEVRTAQQLEACDGLIVPGGESTTMLKLLEIEHLTEPLRRFASHKPLFGTCAGAILLAHSVTHPDQPGLDLIDIDVERNAYGRQTDSRVARVQTGGGEMEAVFIRAPKILRVGSGSRILATYNGDPVWVEQGRHMVTTFHPELTPDARVHQRFLQLI